jgi:hypothetical protein
LKEGNTSVGDAPADSQEESKHVDMTPIGALHYMLVHFLDILLKLWSRIGTFVFTECLLIFKLHNNYANQSRLITNTLLVKTGQAAQSEARIINFVT